MPFIKIKLNSIFSVHCVYGVKLLPRLRLTFRRLNKHKVWHGFKDVTNSIWDCGSSTKTTLHFLLQCQQYQTVRLELLNSIYNFDPKIRNMSNDKLLHLLFYGTKLYCFEINREAIKLTIKILKLSKRFERPLLWSLFPLTPQHLRRSLNTFFLNF